MSAERAVDVPTILSRRKAAVQNTEIHMIEDVECLRRKLEVEPLGDLRISDRREIPVNGSRTTQVL